jgi:hypothetical protein
MLEVGMLTLKDTFIAATVSTRWPRAISTFGRCGAGEAGRTEHLVYRVVGKDYGVLG